MQSLSPPPPAVQWQYMLLSLIGSPLEPKLDQSRMNDWELLCDLSLINEFTGPAWPLCGIAESGWRVETTESLGENASAILFKENSRSQDVQTKTNVGAGWVHELAAGGQHQLEPFWLPSRWTNPVNYHLRVCSRTPDQLLNWLGSFSDLQWHTQPRVV